MADTPRTPLRYSRPKVSAHAALAFLAPNLLVTTLAVAPGTPFYQTDWPNPVVAEQRQQPTHYGTPKTLIAEPVVGDPFYQTDWPNPTLRIKRAGDSYSTPIPLTASVLLDETVRPPVRYQRPKIDWRPAAVLPTPTNLVPLLNATPPDQPYGLNRDFPNPVRPKYVQQPQQLPVNPDNIPYVLYAVGDVGDNPAPAIPRQQPPSQSNALPLLTATPPEFPSSRITDFPNPTLADKPHVGWVQSSNPSSIIVAIYSATDTGENPVLPKPRQQPQTLGSTIGLYTTEINPFVQTDWPNPVLPKARTPGLERFAQIAEVPAEEQPPHQHDWPVPRGRVPLHQEHRYDPILLPGEVGSPFAQLDWQLANGRQPTQFHVRGTPRVLLGEADPLPTIDRPSITRGSTGRGITSGSTSRSIDSSQDD